MRPRALIGGALLLAGLGLAAQSGLTAQRQFLNQLAAAATARNGLPVRYVNEYRKIAYPGGDVPADTGVCTDEIIRSYRALGVDLQKEVHEDMLRNFLAYPRNWGAAAPDTNIDHRRVPNLMTFFARKGERLPITKNDEDYQPGEIVSWQLPNDLGHIGIVTNQKARTGNRYKVLHNIGYGPKVEDVLFAWKIIGHYLYLGPRQ